MRQITAAMARKNADKHFKSTQRFFMKRIKEISKQGNSSWTFDIIDYQNCLDKLLAWLKGLGFVCEKRGCHFICIVWEGETK